MGGPISGEFETHLKRVGLTLQDLAEQMRQFQRDCRFLWEHKLEWQERYPNRWAAVFEGRLVGTGKDLPKLRRRLERKGYPWNRVVVKFIYARGEERIWILQVAA